MGTIIIDRIDKQSRIVRLEINGVFYDLNVDILPIDAKEGDELILIKHKSNRTKHINKLKNKLFVND